MPVDPLAGLDSLERAVALAYLTFGGNRQRIAAKSVFPDLDNRDATPKYLDLLESPIVQKAIRTITQDDMLILPLKSEVTAILLHEARNGARGSSRVKAAEVLARMQGTLSDGKSTNIQVNTFQQSLDEFRKKPREK